MVKVDEEEQDGDGEVNYRFDNEYMFVCTIPDINNHFVDVRVEAVNRDWPNLNTKLPSCKTQNVCLVVDVEKQSRHIQSTLDKSAQSNTMGYPSYISKLDSE